MMQRSALSRVLELSDEDKKALSVRNPDYDNINKFTRYTSRAPEFIEHFWELEDGSYLIPRNYPVFNTSELICEDFTSFGCSIPDQHVITLRDEQKEYFEELVIPTITKGETDIVLNLPTGKGKTILAIYLSLIYGRNTLFVVPTRQLGKQFMQKVKNTVVNNTVGFYDSDKPEKLFDFTIATYQLLAGKKKESYQDSIGVEFYQQFGHIVFDEAHLAAADSWVKIMQEATCKYRTSLTATFRRHDGKESILQHYVGKVIKMKNNLDDRKALVIPVESGIRLTRDETMDYSKKSIPTRLLQIDDRVLRINANGEETEGKIVPKLQNNECIGLQFRCGTRNKEFCKGQSFFLYKFIGIKALEALVSEDKNFQKKIKKVIRIAVKNGRRIIVLSNHLELLFILHRMLKPTRAGVIAGKSKRYREFCAGEGMTQEEMEDYTLTKARVILGIDRLAKTGMDVERADTLLFIHPMADIEQAIGRILRLYKDKKAPLVYYFVHDVYNFKKMWFKAESMFKALGHKVHGKVTLAELKEMGGEPENLE